MADQPLQITFWDVGQGDCSTITLPDGSLIIIDTGPRGSPLIDWLNDNNRPIHAVVLTHNDADHVGALPGIVGGFMPRIRSFYMLVDRPKDNKIFDKIFRCALEGEARGFYKITRLEVGATVWSDASLEAELVTLFPTMSGNLLASSPNTTSGILCLRLKNEPQLLWPGDSTLARVAQQCAGTRPHVMFGPHHGAPQDYKKAAAVVSINAINPGNAFISVATKNKYMHPRPKYVQRLERAGCHVLCSQLTTACDRPAVLNQRPVMKNHLALGLRPPRTLGVTCRGVWQITWDGAGFISDGFDDEHLCRISKLRRPQCLKGRKYFQTAKLGL